MRTSFFRISSLVALTLGFLQFVNVNGYLIDRSDEIEPFYNEGTSSHLTLKRGAEDTFEMSNPADHGSIPEVRKRTLMVRGIKHYKTSMICGHGEVCKVPGVPAFECLCPLHTYCTAQGKWYNSVCGSSLYSLVYKQRG